MHVLAYVQEEDSNFLYLALELCTATLQEVIMFVFSTKLISYAWTFCSTIFGNDYASVGGAPRHTVVVVFVCLCVCSIRAFLGDHNELSNGSCKATTT